jgi:hypothetical protein
MDRKQIEAEFQKAGVEIKDGKVRKSDAEKLSLADSKKEKAVKIQMTIDDQFGIDIAAFRIWELERLAKWLTDFCALGIDSDDLGPASDFGD